MFFSSYGHGREDAAGWIEVICGSMFSGKTEELLLRIRRVEYAKRKWQIFKPAIDTRYSVDQVVSHDNRMQNATIINNSSSILELLQEGVQAVGIDESQFLDAELPEVCRELANAGKRIIAAGLDMDYQGRPFGAMPRLLAEAEYVTKLHAVCMRCGGIAQYTHRKSSSDRQIFLGSVDAYEALCRTCYNREKKTSAHDALLS